MMVGNTNFRKKHSKLWTFISDMSGSKTQVDYILINRKWKNSLKNCEAYNSFSNIGSDHRIVTAKLKLSLRVPRKVARIRYDWNALKDSNSKNNTPSPSAIVINYCATSLSVPMQPRSIRISSLHTRRLRKNTSHKRPQQERRNACLMTLVSPVPESQ